MLCARTRSWPVRSGSRSFAPDLLLGRDLAGATLGVVGLGAIGRAVALRARAFEMRVLGWTPSGRTVPGVESRALDELFSTSDFVSIHLALTPETRGLIDARVIGQHIGIGMKRDLFERQYAAQTQRPTRE